MVICWGWHTFRVRKFWGWHAGQRGVLSTCGRVMGTTGVVVDLPLVAAQRNVAVYRWVRRQQGQDPLQLMASGSMFMRFQSTPGSLHDVFPGVTCTGGTGPYGWCSWGVCAQTTMMRHTLTPTCDTLTT
jgi:hypothetical protein